MKHIEAKHEINKRPGVLIIQVFYLFSIILVGCTSLGEGPYKKSEVYAFDVELRDSLYTFPVLNLKIMENSFFILQQKVVWEGQYLNHKDGSSSKTTSTTGIVQNENKIWLHPPRIGPLELLEAFPFPEVRFPLEVGETWKSTIKVVSGFKELNGKKVESMYTVIRDSISFSNEQTKIWVIHANSKVEDDPRSFEVKYCFSFEKGFIWFDFTIDNKAFAKLELVAHEPHPGVSAR